MKYFGTLFLLGFLLSSCAGWMGENTSELRSFNKKFDDSSGIIKVYPSLKKVEHTVNGKEQRVDLNAKFLEIVEKDLESTGKFKVTSEKESDVQVQYSIKNFRTKNQTMVILNYVSLFLVPAKIEDELSITVEFLAGEEQLGRFEKVGNAFEYRQLFLIFAMPFKPPFNLAENVFSNLNKSILLEANDEGLFKGINENYLD